MRQTLKQRILDYVDSYPGSKFTNGELAAILNAPEPFVRRATYQLFLSGAARDMGQPAYGSINRVTIGSNIER